MSPYLTDEEINEMCKPLTQAAAQIRYLRKEVGLVVKRKPNGKPLVLRAHRDEVLSGKAAPAPAEEIQPEEQPDEGALILHFNKPKTEGKRGQAEKRQPPKAA